MSIPFYLMLTIFSPWIPTSAPLLLRQPEARSENSSIIGATDEASFTAPSASTGRSLAESEGVIPGNTSTGQCWSSWIDYWSKTEAIESRRTVIVSTVSRSAQTLLLSDTKIAVPTTIIDGNGNFPTRTFVTTITEEVAVHTVVNTSSVWTYTLGVERSATITPPPCALPTFVPECQSSWISWANNGALAEWHQPHCTQANITGQVCLNVLSSWLSQQRAGMGEKSGKVGLQELPRTVNGTTMYPESTTLYYWPTSSAVAPGCTVGCQSCAVSGNRVKLLYWPPATTSWRNGTFYAATTSPSGPKTIVTDGMTLTSPTVYMSFNRLHASNSCKVIGQTLRNIIVPITNSATLSSLYGWDRYWGLQQTASFNFTDLYVTPVPESIYASQPRCASSSINIWYYTCLPSGTAGGPICDAMRSNSYSCTRTLPYEPVLSIPLEVRQLQPEWSTCIGGVIGVYDPPSALHEAASIAVPTMPSAVSSTPAQTIPQSGEIPTTAAMPSPTHTRAAPLTDSAVEPQQTKSVGTAASSEHPMVPSATIEPQGQQSSSTVSNDKAPSAQPLSELTSSSPFAAPLQSSENLLSPTNALEVLTEALSSKLSSNGLETLPAPQTAESQSMLRPHDSSSSISIVPSKQNPQASVVFTAGDQTITAAVQSNSIILMDSSITTTIQPGNSVLIGSQHISAEESAIFIGDSSIRLTRTQATTLAAHATPVEVWSANGQALSALQQGSDVVLVNGQSTATLHRGSTAVFAGQTIKLAPNHGIAIDGSTVAIPSATPSSGLRTAHDKESAHPTSTTGEVLSSPRETGAAVAASTSTTTSGSGSGMGCGVSVVLGTLWMMLATYHIFR